MKKILLLSLLSISAYSQTDSERAKIVATYDKAAIAEFVAHAKQYSETQRKLISDFQKKFGDLDKENFSLQRIHNGIPLYFTTSNVGSSATIRTNKMYPGGGMGLSVTGEGMFAGVWDGGKVRNTHLEFPNNKVILNDAATTLSAHATHVTGTIIASGASASSRGIAYGAKAYTHYWDDDYNEMVTFGTNGFLVSNHSYGYASANLPVWLFGSYDESSREIDLLSYNFPYYQIVIAAGNDRSSSFAHVTQNGGYDLLSGTGVSKNGITVAAVNEVLNYTGTSSVTMSDFSNYGPTDDGRIKPDISAKGVAVRSAISGSNFAYDSYNGTSMAAPAVSGMIVLLQKHHNNLYSNYMKAATVRGLIIHSADEAGAAAGPDYEFGWGLANAERAANIISNKTTTSIMEETTLATSQVYTKNVSINTAQKLTATICWTDPVGAANIAGNLNDRAPRLRHNLDLKILKDGVTYYPWKLNPDDLFTPATRNSDNNVDNVEKIEIDAAEPGVYTIQVTHKGTLLGGNQNFTLIASAPNGVGLSNDSFEKSTFLIYPNPASDVLNIAMDSAEEIKEVAILDITGKVIKANVSNQNTVDVSSLQSGVYFVRIATDSKIETKKFVKK